MSEQSEHSNVLPSSVDRAVVELDYLIAESEKEGRRFLKRFAFTSPKTFRTIPIYLLNEHSSEADIKTLICHIKKGKTWGVLSDCGMPCIADPGEKLILGVRELGIPIKALVGPSSITLALVLSGLGAQRFTFWGYLPREEKELAGTLKEIQRLSCKEKAVHLFIETPYRNEKLFGHLMRHLHENTYLCIAKNLTLSSEWVMTKQVRHWKKCALPALNDQLCVFLVRA